MKNLIQKIAEKAVLPIVLLASLASAQYNINSEKLAKWAMKNCERCGNESSPYFFYVSKELDLGDKIAKFAYHDFNKNNIIDKDDRIFLETMSKEKIGDCYLTETYYNGGLDGFSTEKGSEDSAYIDVVYGPKDGSHKHIADKHINANENPSDGDETAKKYNSIAEKILYKLGEIK